jgi:hypothetical protein
MDRGFFEPDMKFATTQFVIRNLEPALDTFDGSDECNRGEKLKNIIFVVNAFNILGITLHQILMEIKIAADNARTNSFKFNDAGILDNFPIWTIKDNSWDYQSSGNLCINSQRYSSF